jgi:hypothetical protein
MGNFEFKEVKLPQYPDDYINSDGLNACYDVNSGEYVIANDNEDIFSSFSKGNTVIMSINNNSRFLLNGKITPEEAYKFLYSNNFLDNSNIYIISSSNDFDADMFKELLEMAGSSSLVDFLEPIDSPLEQSLIFSSDGIKIANDNGDLIDYEVPSYKDSKIIK